MTLPTITAPAGTPVFLADGHSITEDSVFAPVQPGIGHSRQRRRWTVTERVVTVSWLLNTEQLAEVDRWFDEDLQAGALPFAAKVANQGAGPQQLWWAARWMGGRQVEMIPGGFGRLTGALLLTGEGSEDGPA